MATKAAETQYIFDAELEIKDSSVALTASAALQVDGAAQIIDLGDDAKFIGDMVIDISAIDIASLNERYDVILQGSDSASFASGIEELARCVVGDGTTIAAGMDVDSDIGRYVTPFRNERNGRHYRYLRGYLVVAGTTPSLTFVVYLSKHKPN